MTTLTTALARHNITPADDLLAQIEVPTTPGRPQRQGDVGVFPLVCVDPDTNERVVVRAPFGKAELDAMTQVPHAGINVVVGEATGNKHILHPDTTDSVILWAPAPTRPGSVLLGNLRVVTGVAMLVHTDEHGANAFGPGDYTLHGKREQAAEIRLVAD